MPLKPVTAPPRAPESDRFAISPGIGLNSRPSANQPLNTPVARAPEPEFGADDSDPMTEIENLIGLDCSHAILTSAKEGIGIPELLAAVAERIPAPKGAEVYIIWPGDGAVIDHQFNTTDVCIIVKTALIAGRYTRHYDLE